MSISITVRLDREYLQENMDCVVRIFLIIRLDKRDLHENMDCVGEDFHNYNWTEVIFRKIWTVW